MRISLRGTFFSHSGVRIGGYTLIELAMVIMVGGTLIGTFASVANVYMKTQDQQTTLNNASMITTALNDFLVQNGRYPCPAPIDAARSDPAYGLEGTCPLQSIPTGQCGGGNGSGFCVEQSDRQWGPNPPLNWNAAQPWPPAGWSDRVIRGGVPFRTLAIPEYIAEDGYKARFEYAVTESLAGPGTYNSLNGGIDVWDENGKSLVTPPPGTLSGNGALHYIVISTGPDRAGAYSHEGALIYPCPAIGATKDQLNCYTWTGSGGPQAIYRMAAYADASGPAHFDDTVKYYSSTQIPLWKVTGTLGIDLDDLVNAGNGSGSNVGKVAIGIQPVATATSAALQVKGNVRAEGNALASQLCAPGAANCVQSALNLTCPAGYATGFKGSSSHLKCTPDPQVTCPAGDMMTGVDADGNLLCQQAVTCPPISTAMCWDAAISDYDYDIIPASSAAGYPGEIYTTPPAIVADGGNYTQTFQCEPAQGGANWVQVSSAGLCSCTAISGVPASFSCSQVMGGSSQGWTGSVQELVSVVCPGAVETDTPVAGGNTCQCIPYTTTSTTSCPYGFTGTTTTTQSFTCQADLTQLGTLNPPVTTSACVCDPTVIETRTISCQSAGYSAGYLTGSVTQTSSQVCPAGTWTAWTTTTDTCSGACSNWTQSQTIGCPSGQTGTQIQQQTFDCNSNSWGPWATVTNNCAGIVYTWHVSGTAGGIVTNDTGDVLVNSTCATQSSYSYSCVQDVGNGNYMRYTSCQCY